MSQNVAEVLEGRRQNLFEKMSSNQDLSNVVMGFLGRIIVMCHQMGKPIQGVDCTSVTEFMDEFRFGISFNTMLVTPPGLWQMGGDLLTYARSRSSRLAMVLEQNARLIRTLTEVVECVDKYCQRKRIPFKDFKIKKAFIHPKTNTCIIRAGIPELKDRFR